MDENATRVAFLRYRIDANDNIAYVDEAWNRFAHENEGNELIDERVRGRNLWEFVADDETRQLYRHIVERARKGNPVRFTLRCDSPTCRRLLEMTIAALGDGSVEFTTRTIREEPRDRVEVLSRHAPRADDFLRFCAWCNRIDIASETWAEVEEAVETLRLFEREIMPQITHGICATCLGKMKATLQSA